MNGSKDFGDVSSSGNQKGEGDDHENDRFINAAIVLSAGTLAVTKLLTIDHDYWHVSDVYAFKVMVYVFLRCV